MQRRYGRIIAVSSELAQVARAIWPTTSPPKASSSPSFARSARELGPHGITVNTPRAGSIEVDAERLVVTDHAAMVDRQLARQCIQRAAGPPTSPPQSSSSPQRRPDSSPDSLTVDGEWHLT